MHNVASVSFQLLRGEVCTKDGKSLVTIAAIVGAERDSSAFRLKNFSRVSMRSSGECQAASNKASSSRSCLKQTETAA